MMKLKSFFTGILLLIIVFIMVVLVALIYRANERSTIKSYIFQTGNYSSQRAGNLQDINNISANDLRNKLIKKYVSEYFKVIPGDTDVKNRPILRNLSAPNVFSQWQKDEASNISKMSQKQIFRMIRVRDDGIATLEESRKKNKKTPTGREEVFYMVRYNTLTWTESNVMKTEPIKDEASVVIGIQFEPGIRDTINKEKIDIKNYLQKGENPIGLFKFRVTTVITKDL